MRRTLAALAVLFGVGLLLAVAIGEALSRPSTRPVGDAPADLHAVAVRIPVSTGATVSGWFSGGEPGRGAVLLLHGIRADRRASVDRARFLRAAGYSVLLIDLPAHGESAGTRITFGVREGEGVRAALAHLRDRLPGERIGVIGVSLGAVSLVLARPARAPDAVVLESMYPTLADAVADRLAIRFGPAGRHFAPLLLWQLPLFLGIPVDRVRPIAEIASLGAPVLVASGTDDRHTTFAETQRIFRAAREPKELWAVAGAAHVDLHAYAPKAYEATILRFLARHLRT